MHRKGVISKNMNSENLILESKLIEVASHKNYREATFLISVLGEPDAYNRIIPEDVGEKYAKTIIGYPIVAKLKKNIFGEASDIGGHEVYEVKLKNGRKQKRFGTIPIGSVLDAWVEERELDDFDEPKKCILCSTKLWSSRFPEYFKVIDKLWEKGGISSSWELTASKVEEKDGFKIYKVIEFIGNAILGSGHVPAVKQSGILEYAEFEDYETELANALEKDMYDMNMAEADLDIKTNKEENILAKDSVKGILDTPVEDTAEKNEKANSAVEDTASKDDKKDEIEDKDQDDEQDKKKDKKEEAECKTKKKKETAEVEVENEDNSDVASLTDGDLINKISKACREKVNCSWGYISYWFPEDHTAWFKPCDTESQLDYKLFTYEVVDDEVTVSEPTDVKLTVSIPDVNSEIASRDEKIATLTAELELKNEAVISAGEKIGKLNVEISELKPYKEKVEQAEQEKIEAEIAEEKKSLKENMLKGGLFTEEEIEQAEIAELIEARNKSAINGLIAERYIASFDKEVVENKNESEETATASLEVDDVVEDNPIDFMKTFLSKRK